MKKINESITKLLVNHINNYEDIIFDAMHILLNGNYIKYDINNSIYINKKVSLTEETFQKILSNINEKTNKRKSKGVYYTPNDAAKYIACNSFITYVTKDNEKTYSIENGIKFLSELKKEEIINLLNNATIIDPTCGTGEFLVAALEIKLLLLNRISKEIEDEEILKICKTIYGNDIDDESIDISKIRLFFYIVNKLKKPESYKVLAEILANQFLNIDFILKSKKIKNKFDIVIGNPPYVEYGKYSKKDILKNKFGNVYADVIKNSIDILKIDGVLGFVIPISYSATARMKNIREYVAKNSDRQFILSFADRPDCLFNGVHQKLDILIVKKGTGKNLIYTSNYKHWYKEEREKLLNGREVKACRKYSEEFIPKIGNNIEESIFEKVYTNSDENLYQNQAKVGKEIYLNMRACFWIKAFSFNPGSNEYKKFIFKEERNDFILCLLNSSLFWIYWTIMSDCWHITTKELKSFYVPTIIEGQGKFEKLSKELEKKLEDTKEFVNTKQTQYEYKHKLCKDVIDKIDNELAKIYNFSDEELKYIKSFAKKYRMGR